VSGKDHDVPRVLIAEDNADLRELCRVHLEAAGIEVVEAGDGYAALEVARREQLDLALLDIVMPGLDGLRVAEILRDELADDIRIVFISGRARFENQVEGLEHGAADYITKPFEPEELVGRVEELLRRGS
jgi:two-component system, OmpR family, alkaline phosphatase synthesis response regulator PhoP